MTSIEIRNSFLDFFRGKEHRIVPSAPMVIKGDPTLMFTNAGMNQFKDIFLGNTSILVPRIANAQKCLRVSGKHNDLEEVGHDTYHHTMFEMLGNWSFGDYFKNEAIHWAWEFLVGILKINPERLYATVFEGSKEEGLEPDNEAKEIWKKYLPEDRIIYGSRKDNFWEMGECGPCGPCSEVHVDIRDENERSKIAGVHLVNKGHPHVIEIWNLVFIQFNRKADGKLEQLPAKHVDTGMGFERLCMVVQGKQSNYDTDVFQLIIKEIGKLSGKNYGENNDADIAMRVIADHLRTIAFSIADGQLPSNAKAGYVIRRIFRRAIRYAYTFLNQTEPFIYKLVPVLIQVMGEAYPEIIAQRNLIEKAMIEEETTFLKTLEKGIKMLDTVISETKAEGSTIISGNIAFKMYDSCGFPLDLTELILREHQMSVNLEEYNSEMEKQKQRSQQDAKLDAGDWIILVEDDIEEFVGYDYTESDIVITKYRKVVAKGKTQYHLVFNFTPFYAESGGQVGDKGFIQYQDEKIEIIDTKKENNLIIHISENLPADLTKTFKAVVNVDNRLSTMCNHSATHLLHSALREVLGNHVEQKGSLVEPERLRFDFAHFQKLTDEEIEKVEHYVNQRIRENYNLEEKRAIPTEEAHKMGAIALFGEKYGDLVRVIKFGSSIELCGGTHVKNTGQIGIFKILTETAIAAGIRRIEAITSINAEKYINQQFNTVKQLKQFFKTSKDIVKSVEDLMLQNADLIKQIESLQKEKLVQIKSDLLTQVKQINGVNVIAAIITIDSPALLKDLSYQIKGQVNDLFMILGTASDGKANLSVMISDNLVENKKLNANTIIREASKEINGGGGGQPFYATAGGKNPDGLQKAIDKALEMIK